MVIKLDPKKYLNIVPELIQCQNSYCVQKINYISRCKEATTYSTKIVFRHQYLDNKVLTASADLLVVCKQPTHGENAPKFSETQYQFEIEESLEINSIARNVLIEVDDDSNELSLYRAGFNLELLNTNDLSPVNQFEIVPNYGQGLLISSLRLKQKIDFNNGIMAYTVSF